jgi:hypothetical protein
MLWPKIGGNAGKQDAGQGDDQADQRSEESAAADAAGKALLLPSLWLTVLFVVYITQYFRPGYNGMCLCLIQNTFIFGCFVAGVIGVEENKIMFSSFDLNIVNTCAV